MLPEQRRRKILELIQEEGSAKVVNLSQIFSVTEPTIRQDLDKLELEGLIIRQHGGAFLKSMPDKVKSLSLQHLENMEQKSLIGKKAAEFINDGDSIILDAGTTTTEIAKNLEQKKNLMVVTNALNIALLLGTNFNIEVFMTGGEFKPPTLSLTGDRAAIFFDKIHVNKLFLAASGISLSGNLTYPGLSDIPVKKAMLSSAEEVYVVIDSSKIGKTAFASLGPVHPLQYIITDSGISRSALDHFQSKGIKVIIA